MASARPTTAPTLRLLAGAAVAALMLAGCTAQASSADSVQKACVDTSSAAIMLIDVSAACSAGFVDAVFVTQAPADGVDGSDGAAGKNGSDGEPGRDGSAGPVGPRGETGARGATGPAGPIGAAGPTGAAGLDGINGIDGATGAVGPAGTPGLIGPQGEPGPAGPQGLVGSTGPQGPAGPRGFPGVQGETGARGPTGNSALSAFFGTSVGAARDGLGGDCVIGTLSLTAGTVSEGLKADGSVLPISSHPALFTLFGNTYGGTEGSSFALPDMSAVTPNNMTWSICEFGVYPQTKD